MHWDHPLSDLVNPAAYREWLLGRRLKTILKEEREEVTMARIFVYDGRDFPDPDPAMSVPDVKKYFADFFPELATAETREVDKDDKHYVEFIRKTGTKNRKRV